GNSSMSRHQFVGEVLEDLGDWLSIEVKNRFELGDRMELMTPSGNHSFVLQSLLDRHGQPAEIAPGTGHVLRIPRPEGATAQMALLLRCLPTTELACRHSLNPSERGLLAPCPASISFRPWIPVTDGLVASSDSGPAPGPDRVSSGIQLGPPDPGPGADRLARPGPGVRRGAALRQPVCGARTEERR